MIDALVLLLYGSGRIAFVQTLYNFLLQDYHLVELLIP